MDDLSDLLGKVARKDLQRLAKSIGVKVMLAGVCILDIVTSATQANGKSAEIVALLIEAHDAEPSKFVGTPEVAELLPGWQPCTASQPAHIAADIASEAQPTSQPDTALSPLPHSGAVDDAMADQPPTEEAPALQTNPLFDEPDPPQAMDATDTPAGKENSTPAAQATPCQLTEEAMRRAYEKGAAST